MKRVKEILAMSGIAVVILLCVFLYSSGYKRGVMETRQKDLPFIVDEIVHLHDLLIVANAVSTIGRQENLPTDPDCVNRFSLSRTINDLSLFVNRLEDMPGPKPYFVYEETQRFKNKYLAPDNQGKDSPPFLSEELHDCDMVSTNGVIMFVPHEPSFRSEF